MKLECCGQTMTLCPWMKTINQTQWRRWQRWIQPSLMIPLWPSMRPGDFLQVCPVKMDYPLLFETCLLHTYANCFSVSHVKPWSWNAVSWCICTTGWRRWTQSSSMMPLCGPGCLHICPFRWIIHFYLNLSCSILMLIVFLSHVKPWSWNAVARRWLCAPWWRRSIKLNEEDGKDGPNPPWWYLFDQACLQVCPFKMDDPLLFETCLLHTYANCFSVSHVKPWSWNAVSWCIGTTGWRRWTQSSSMMPLCPRMSSYMSFQVD